MRTKHLAWLPVAAGLVLCPALAAAQAFPKQMRIIVGSVPATGPDLIARLLAPKFGETFHSNVVVENRPGSNGIVGALYTAKAPPDGSVTMMGNAGTHAINAALYRKLPYDPERDFVAVSEIAAVPLALVVHPSVPARTVQELLALARRMPGRLNVAIAGAAGELMGNALKLQAKVAMNNVPYKGGSQAALAVLSGEADLVFTSYVVFAPHLESGKLRVLGVSGAQRLPQLPNVPTIAESGVPGYDHEQWYALFAPARTPAPLVQGMYHEVVRAVNTPDFHRRLVATGHRIVAGTPEQLTEKVHREIEKTRAIMKASGMPQQ